MSADSASGQPAFPETPRQPSSESAGGSVAGSDGRLPIRCTHCGFVGTAETPAESTQICPNCGSTLRGDSEQTRSYVAAPRRLGNFELMERVGAGAYGVVWKSRDVKLGRIVALKIPHPGVVVTDEHQRRFSREARSAALLRHPGIVSIHEVGHDEGLSFLVCDFVHGITLAELLENSRLDFRETAELIAQIADALHYAHSMGVVHRDLKPSNIMMERPRFNLSAEGTPQVGEAAETGDASASEVIRSGSSSMYHLYHAPIHETIGRPLIMDFGLALRDEGEATMTTDGQVLGTPAYMSPEQAAGQGHRVDGRTDIYSLGVMLYKMLTGEMPFHGSARALLDQVIHIEPPSPRQRNKRIPRDLETITLKCMAKQPKRRYSSSAEVVAELRRWLGGEPIRARPVGTLEKTWRWSLRNPMLAMSLAITMIALMLTTGVAVAFGLNKSEAARRIKAEQESTFRALARAESERQLADKQRIQAERLWISLSMDRALKLCQEGDVPRGILWLARTLEHAAGSHPEFERVIRINLANWRARLQQHSFQMIHNGHVVHVTFRPDGRILATASFDNTARLWDCRTGDPVGSIMRHEAGISTCVFSPDGKWLATASYDTTARIWNAETGEPRTQPLPHKSVVWDLAFSSNGNLLGTAADDGMVRLWDTATGVPVGQPLPHPAVRLVRFSPTNGIMLTAGNDNRGRLWNLGSQQAVAKPLVHRGDIRDAVFSNDGKLVFTGSADDSVKIWNVETGELAGKDLEHSLDIRAVAVRPDGQLLASASSDKSVKLWDLLSGEERLTRLRHGRTVRNVSFSRDGELLITSGDDWTARLWHVDSGQCRGILQHGQIVLASVISPDGTLAATASADRTARLWPVTDALAECRVMYLSDTVRSGAFTPDGKRFAVGTSNGRVLVAEADTFQPVFEIRHAQSVNSLSFSKDGQWLATASWDKSAQVWNAHNGASHGAPLLHSSLLHAVAFHPEGRMIVTASDDGSAHFWDISTGREDGVPLRHNDAIFAIAFSPDGTQVVTGSQDMTARVWDVATRRQVLGSFLHEGTVTAVAFSPDGNTVLTGSGDNSARLWDLESGKSVGEPFQHQGRVYAVAFAKDGKSILTGGADDTVVLWDLATRKPLAPPMNHSSFVRAIDITANGDQVLTGSSDKTVKLWKLPAAIDSDVQDLTLWSQVVTGMELDKDGAVQVLSSSTFRDRKKAWERQSKVSQTGTPSRETASRP